MCTSAEEGATDEDMREGDGGAGGGIVLVLDVGASRDMLFESEGMLLILGGFTLFIVEGKLLLVDGNVEVLLVLLLNICCCCCCIPGNVESFVDRSMVVFSNADLELFIIIELLLPGN